MRPPSGGPPRPSISPLVWVAAGVWCGSLLGAELGVRGAAGAPAAVAAGWLAAASLSALALALRRRRGAAVLAALAVGVATSLAHGALVWAAAGAADACGPREWTGVVSADPRPGPTGMRVAVTLADAPARGLAAALTWPDDAPMPRYGQEVRFSARLARPDAAQAWAAASLRRGVALTGRPWRLGEARWPATPAGAVAAWRAASLERLRSAGGAGAPVVAAMAFGDREAVRGSPAEEDARAAGVAWALTASGLHLGVAVLTAEWAAALVGLRRRGRAAAAIACAAAMVCAAGMRLSLVRAALVAACAAVGATSGRRRDGTAAAGAVVAAMVAFDPLAAWDSGLLLGVLAVAGIAAFAPLARAWIAPVVGRRLAWGLGASVAAQAAVAPLAASLFGALGVWGPLALAVSAPLVQIAVLLGLTGAAVAVVAPGPGTALLGLSGLPAQGAALVWRAAAALPAAVVPVPAVPWWGWLAWGAAAVAAWVAWPLPRRAARVRIGAAVAAVALAAAAFAPSATGPGLVVLDVGQGDCVLVRDGGEALLVDVGPDPAVLRRALARARVRALSGLVLTHAHDDHTGGLAGLAGVARPGWIGVPDVEDAAVARLARECARRTREVVRLRRDMAWRVGRTSVRVLWPGGGERGLDANDTSVVLLLERDGRRAILLGDAEERAQRGAVRAFDGVVDVMKAAHHGSCNGVLPETLAVWRPTVALVSCGAGNRFGHPHRAALQALRGIGAVVRRTDREGDLGVALSGQALGDVAAGRPAGVCDNRSDPQRPLRAPAGAPSDETSTWHPPTSATSSRSTSYSVPRSCSSTARCAACASVSRPWPTSTSTWTPSRASRSPPTRSSTPPTRCRS